VEILGLLAIVLCLEAMRWGAIGLALVAAAGAMLWSTRGVIVYG